MEKTKARVRRATRIHARIRTKVTGTAERPRLAVRQDAEVHLGPAHRRRGRARRWRTRRRARSDVRGKAKSATNKNGGAVKVGALIAERAQEKGISAVVFDRGGHLYHGNVKALADSAREKGLKF